MPMDLQSASIFRIASPFGIYKLGKLRVYLPELMNRRERIMRQSPKVELIDFGFSGSQKLGEVNFFKGVFKKMANFLLSGLTIKNNLYI